MIHHYTSIDTLALILKSRKIRFTRMDLVDDLTENEGLPTAIEKLAFVSCWSEDESENIALWNMYTPKMHGVKISLPKHPWRQFVLKPGRYFDFITIHQDMKTPLPMEEIFAENYLIYPMFDFDEVDNTHSWFYKKVVYRDDYSEIYRNILQFNQASKTHELRGIWEIGKYKSKQWEFQRESRYTLYCETTLPLNHPLINGDRNEQLKAKFIPYNAPNDPILKDFHNLEWIDVPLDEEYLKNVTVTLGPMCSISDAIIVEALLKEYAPNGSMKNSPLTGRIRTK